MREQIIITENSYEIKKSICESCSNYTKFDQHFFTCSKSGVPVGNIWLFRSKECACPENQWIDNSYS